MVSQPRLTPDGKAQADSNAQQPRQVVSISRGLQRCHRASDGVMIPLPTMRLQLDFDLNEPIVVRIRICGIDYDRKENLLNDTEKHTLMKNLSRHVAHLSVNIGERHLWNDDSLEQAAHYIESEFRAAGYVPMRQTFMSYRKPISNIVVEKNGSSQHLIVVGAHYDSVPGSPGADDNASAVAGMIELARMLKDIRCTSSFRFLAFVNEESPSFGTEYMGSMQYARYLKERGENVAFMIALEMIGYFDKQRLQTYPLRRDAMFLSKKRRFHRNYRRSQFPPACARVGAQNASRGMR